MLVLSRKLDERILIGPEIRITLVRIGPNSVRLGIEAPAHFSIVREELTAVANDKSESRMTGYGPPSR